MRLQLERKPIQPRHRIFGIDVSKLIDLPAILILGGDPGAGETAERLIES
jgi:hypothetical protein